MKLKRRSTAFTLTLFCALFSLMLAACGSGAHSTKLNYNVNNGSIQSKPGATSTSIGTPGASKRTEFVGEIPDANAWIALASDGKNMVGFTTDGSPDHTPTFAHWYQGTVTNNSVQATPAIEVSPAVQATPTSGSSQGQLTANLTPNAAMGKVTLGDGKSYPFTANAIADPNSPVGLYESSETVNNVKYQAGWIIPPNAVPSATPSATETAGVPSTATPSATETATTTPGANPSGASAIINQQTGELLSAPMPTAQDLSSQQISVPNLGTLKLRH
jgi:hypothetical protein